ncbi:MAG TPA: CcmD family protein [Bryobacteraceae bacterium]|jgi:CcmD family protein|nr:CcmD family protein [Bryobacteraceae bacterium]
MDARNFTFMFYGFTAAWLIVMIYVIILARRSARLRKELENVKHLMQADEAARDHRSEERVR